MENIQTLPPWPCPDRLDRPVSRQAYGARRKVSPWDDLLQRPSIGLPSCSSRRAPAPRTASLTRRPDSRPPVCADAVTVRDWDEGHVAPPHAQEPWRCHPPVATADGRVGMRPDPAPPVRQAPPHRHAGVGQRPCFPDEGHADPRTLEQPFPAPESNRSTARRKRIQQRNVEEVLAVRSPKRAQSSASVLSWWCTTRATGETSARVPVQSTTGVGIEHGAGPQEAIDQCRTHRATSSATRPCLLRCADQRGIRPHAVLAGRPRQAQPPHLCGVRDSSCAGVLAGRADAVVDRPSGLPPGWAAARAQRPPPCHRTIQCPLSIPGKHSAQGWAAGVGHASGSFHLRPPGGSRGPVQLLSVVALHVPEPPPRELLGIVPWAGAGVGSPIMWNSLAHIGAGSALQCATMWRMPDRLARRRRVKRLEPT